jgi:hypothetical protein
LKKVTLLLIVAIVAIGFAIATTPVLAMKDMRGLSATGAAAEGVVATGAAAAAGTAAGGTVKSLYTPSGKRITGPDRAIHSFQALAYSVHSSRTLYIIAAAKILSAISIALENDAFQPNYWWNMLAVGVSIVAIGSAVSAALVLLTPPKIGEKAETGRIRQTWIPGIVVILIGVALVYSLGFL